MANGNKKRRTRPIDNYTNLFNDKEVQQSEDLRENLLNPPRKRRTVNNDGQDFSDIVLPSGNTGRQKKKQLFENDPYTYTNVEYQAARHNAQNALLSHPLNTYDNTFQPGAAHHDLVLNEYVDERTQWWHHMWNTASEIKIDRFKGQALKAEMEIDDLLNNSAFTRKDIEEGNVTDSNLLQKIQDLKEEISEANKNVEEEEAKIAERDKVSDHYKWKAMQGQEDEGTGLFKYWGSAEAAEDVGGAMSDAGWLAATIGAGVAGGAAATGLWAAPANSVPVAGQIAYGVAILGGMVVGGIGSVVMRDNESHAEMYSAYEQRKDGLMRDWAIRNGGKEPDPNTEEGKKIIAMIEGQARKGAEDVFRKNKLLLAGDVAQIGIGFLPWGGVLGSMGLKAAKIPYMAKKWSDRVKRLGRIGTMMGVQGAIEGWEEGYQYITKMDYLQGKYDDQGGTYLENINFKSTFGSIEGMGQMAISGLTGNQPYTKEFRNSVRAGGVLGMGLGVGFSQTQALSNRAHKNYVFNKYSDEIAELNDAKWQELLSGEQSLARSEMIYNAMKNDGGDRMYKALRWLQRYNDSGGAGTIDTDLMDFKAIDSEIKSQKNLFNQLQGKEYTHLTDEQRLNLMKANGFAIQGKRNTQKTIEKATERLTKAKAKAEPDIPENLRPAWNTLQELEAAKNLKKIIEKTKVNKAPGSKTFLKWQNKKKIKAIDEMIAAQEKALGEQLKALGLKNAKELPSVQSEKEVVKTLEELRMAELDQGLFTESQQQILNKNQAFRVQKHPWFQEVEHNAKERKKRKDAKLKEEKEYKNSVLDDDQNVNEGDTVWAFGGRVKGVLKKIKMPDGTSMWAIVDQFGEEVLLSEKEYKSLEKRTPKEDFKSEIEEVIEKKKRKKNKKKETTEDPQKEEQLSLEFDENNPAEGNDKQQNQTKNQNEQNKKDKKVKEENIPNAPEEDSKTEDYDSYSSDDQNNRDDVNINVDKNKFTSKLYKFIHSRSRKALKALKVEYIIDKESYSQLPPIIQKRIKDGKAITKAWIKAQQKKGNDYATLIAKHLNVKVRLTDPKTGESVMTNLFAMNEMSSQPEALNTLSLGLEILNSYIQDPTKKIYGSIVYATWGIFNNQSKTVEKYGPGGKFKISSLFKKSKPVLAYNNKGVIVDGLNIYSESNNGSGRWYAIFSDPIENTKIPIKLNQRDLNNKEVDELWEIVKGLIFSTTDDPFTMGALYKNSGLTVSQYLRLLTYLTPANEMPSIDEIENSSANIFGFVQASNNSSSYFQVGNTAFTKGSFDSTSEAKLKAQFRKKLLQDGYNKKRAAHSGAFNGNIFQMPLLQDTNIEEFTFLGKTYKLGVNDDYNLDFIEDSGILTTDIQVDEFGRVQHNRQVVVGQDVTRSDKKSKSKPKKKKKTRTNNDTLKSEDQQKSEDPKFDENENQDYDPDMDDFGFTMEVEEDNSIDQELIDTEAAIKWLDKTFGGIIPTRVKEGILKVGKKGIKAFALFSKGMVTISNKAKKGAEYHEAWHVVEEMYLTPKEIAALNKETSKKYGEPTSEQLQKIKEKYAGYDLTDKQARNIHFQEVRAEEYRNFENTQLEQRKTLFGKLSQRFYNFLEKYLLDVFRKPSSRKYFSRISRGYYAEQAPVRMALSSESFKQVSNEASLEEAGFNAKDRSEIAKSLILMLIQQSGKYKNIKDLSNIKVSKNIITGYLLNKIKKAEAAGDKNTAANLKILLENADYFYNPETKEGAIVDMLKLATLELATEADDKNNKDVSQAMSAHFEFGGKQNSTINTKILLSYFPKFSKEGKPVIDPRTGLIQVENSSTIWNVLESELAGIVDYYDNDGNFVYAYDQMMDKIDQLAKSKPTFEKVSAAIKSLDDHQKTQLFNTFSKTNMNFLTALVTKIAKNSEGGGTKIENFWKFINPAVQSRKYRLKEEWSENLKMSGIFKLNDENTLVIEESAVKRIKSKWMSLKERYTAVEKSLKSKEPQDQIVPDSIKYDIISLLKDIGIEVSIDAIDLHISSKDTQLQGIRQLMIGTPQKGKAAKHGLRDLLNAVANVEKLALLPARGKGWDIKNKPHDYSYSFVMELAEAEALAGESYSQTTIIGPESKTFWIYSLNNHLFKFAGRVNASAMERRKIKENSWAQSSQWAKQLLISGKDIAIRTFNNLKEQGSRDAGSSNTTMSPQQEHATRINLTLKNTFSLPNMADKSIWYLVEGFAPINVYEDGTQGFEYNHQTGEVTWGTAVTRVFANYAIDEIIRIQSVHEELFGKNKLENEDLIEYYHYTKLDKEGNPIRETANGLKFVMFPSLNNEQALIDMGVMNKTGKFIVNFNQEKVKDYINPIIKNILSARFVKELELAVENGVVKERRSEAGFKILTNKQIDQEIISGILRKERIQKKPTLKMNAAISLAIAQYMINNMVSFVETSKILSGDPAFYKNLDDMAKRLPELIAPGQDLRILEGKEFFNAAIVRDYTIDESKYYKNYLSWYMKQGMTQEEAKEILAPYKNINVTDAQAYITLGRWRDLMVMLGKWDETYDPMYKRLSNPEKYGQPTVEDLNMILAQPLKGMYFGMRDGIKGSNGISNMKIPTYLKYSQAVLIPALTKNRELAKLEKLMKEQNVDEVIFESGIKVGAKLPTKIHKDGTLGDIIEDATLNPFQLENRNWKLQQELSPHVSPLQLEGSQIKKNIIGNIDLEASFKVPTHMEKQEDGSFVQKYKEVSGYELVKEVHAIDRALSDDQKTSLEQEWGIDYLGMDINDQPIYTIKNLEKVQKILYKSFAEKESTSQKLLKSLELEERGGKLSWRYGGETGLDSHPYSEQIGNMLSSLITKRTVKLEMPGGSYIQMSNFGFQKTSRFSGLDKATQNEILKGVNENKLGPAYVTKSGVVRAQIFLPSWFKDMIPGVDGMSNSQIKKYIKDKRLLRAIGYRIPNQGMSSIDSLDVVGFLPAHMGDTVVAYDEITSKTGSDFDIDKLYIMLPSFGVRENNDGTKSPFYVEYDGRRDIEGNKAARSKDKGLFVKALRNRKLELYDAILTSPNTFVQLVSPLDSVGLKNDAAMVRYLENKHLLSKQQINEIESSIGTSEFYSTVSNIVSNLQDLEWFSPAYQMHLKETFLGGQTGVGQTARHLVDHMISQWSNDQALESPLFFNEQNLLIGNVTKNNNTDLSQIYTRNSLNMISNTLSSRLDAYVDIAKDPYIFYINNNSITANTVFMMDRIGVDPTWTNSFMSLPSIKEYVKYEKYLRGTTEGLEINGKVYFTKAEDIIIEALSKQVRIDRGLSKTDPLPIVNLSNPESLAKYHVRNKYNIKSTEEIEKSSVYQETLEKINNNELKIDDIITVKDLYDMIDSSKETNAYQKLVMFKFFLDLKKKGTALNKIVTASKADTQGASRGLLGSIVSKNLIEQAILDNTFEGFSQRFDETMLGKYQENGPDFMYNLFRDFFILGSPMIEESLYEIGNTVGKKWNMKTDEEMLRKTYNAFKTYLLSNTAYWKSIDVESLMYGDNSIAHQLYFYKNDEKSTIKDNALVKYLSPSFSNLKGGYDYITSPATSKKDGKEKDVLTEAWDKLLNHEDKKVQKFAKDLYKVSLIESGLQNTLFSYHELAPLDFESETGLHQQYGILVNNIKDIGINSSEIMDFLRGQTGNTSLVPEIELRGTEGKLDLKGIGNRPLHIILEPKGSRMKYVTRKAPVLEEEIGYNIFTPFIELKADNERHLYENVGYTKEGNAVYRLSERTGRYDKGKAIFESPGQTAIQENEIIKINKKGEKVYILDLPFVKEKTQEYLEGGVSRREALEINNDISPFYNESVENEMSIQDDISLTGFQLIDMKEDLNSILDPSYELKNSFYAPVQSVKGAIKLQKFRTIAEALEKRVHIEDAIKSAVKYNLELKEYLKNTQGELAFKNEEGVYKRYGYFMGKVRSMIGQESLIDILNLETASLYEYKGETMSIPNNSIPAITLLDMLQQETGNSNTYSLLYNLMRNKMRSNPIDIMFVPENEFGLFLGKSKNTIAEYQYDNNFEQAMIVAREIKKDGKLDKKAIGIAVLHELLHYYTVEEVSKDGEFRSKIKELVGMYMQEHADTIPKALRQHLNPDNFTGDPVNDEMAQTRMLGEFITYGLTDPIVIKQLKKSMVTDKQGTVKSLWKSMIDTILDLFNVEKNDSLYDLLFRTVDEFVEKSVDLQDAQSQRSKYISSLYNNKDSRNALGRVEKTSRQPNKKCD